VNAGVLKRGYGDSDLRVNSSLIVAAKRLRDEVGTLSFAGAVAHVYNPLDYAWAAHEVYLRRYGAGPKRVLFLGMNPGPFGMVQTGVPFGEVAAVRDWLGIRAEIARPRGEHPKRPITGFACTRSEVSGRRLWGLFRDRFGTAEVFFRDHFVVNYCPLAFVASTSRNITPDQLAAPERAALFDRCDEHLRATVKVLEPEWIIGVGDFAAKRAMLALPGIEVGIRRILHPSPANPLANRDWAGIASTQLRELGVWS
jgi:single-strand selective monofunctional uracil DNA glycosylase